MLNNLASPGDLLPFPGSPFSVELVDAAVQALRNALGWHVAPSVEETITVDSRGGRYLFLPSLNITAVTEVRDVTGATPVVITDWFQTGGATLVRDAGWPCRESAIEVDVTHGYSACPPDLFPVIAELCQSITRTQGLKSVSIDDYSETLDPSSVAALPPTAAAYRVPRRSR